MMRPQRRRSLDRVLNALRVGEPTRFRDVVDFSGRSPKTVRRCLVTLRGTGVVQRQRVTYATPVGRLTCWEYLYRRVR